MLIFPNIRTFYFLLPLLSVFLFSCGNLKYLEKDEILLSKNEIKIIGKEKKEKITFLEEDITSLIHPKPNTKTLKLFRTKLWLWNKAKHRKNQQDTNFIERSILNKIGESPSLVNTKNTTNSVQNIERYLINNGYFDGTVTYTEKTIGPKKKKAISSYIVTLNNPLIIDSLYLTSQDSIIGKIIKNPIHLTAGMKISKSNFSTEKNAIVNLLRNKGYAKFFPTYIEFDADTTNNKVSVNVKIKNPTPTSIHKKYTIKNIYVSPNFNPIANNTKRDTMLFEDYYFIIPSGDKTTIKKHLIANAIDFKKGNYFQQKKYESTAKKLSEIDIFKYQNIDFNFIDSNKIDIKINLQPSKKMSIGGDLEVSNISGTTVGNSIGTNVNLSFKNKNLFRGAEKFEFNISNSLEYSLEKNDTITLKSLFNSIDIGISARVSFPKFMVPLPLKRPGKTILSLSYDYLSRRNFYKYRTINASYGYEWFETSKKNKKHIYNIASLDLLQPSVEPTFEELVLNDNLFLKNSFQNQLFLGQNYSFIHQTGLLKKLGSSFYFRGNLEVAPIELAGEGASQYYKGDVDFRYKYNLPNNRSIATRIGVGYGNAFSNKATLPYVKQYYVGGPSSIRAWKIRELGPGAYLEDNLDNLQPYQTGNIKFESSAEYRFNLIKFFYLEGALFLDAGNIWTIEEDPDRPCPDGAPCNAISNNFLDQIAVGGGWGFRFDFTYFIIRLDMAYKLRTPYKVNDSHQVYSTNNHFGLRPALKDAVYNLAIGYPF